MFYPDKLITEVEYAEIMNKYAAMKGAEVSFTPANAEGVVYKMDAENAIKSVLDAPEKEEAAE